MPIFFPLSNWTLSSPCSSIATVTMKKVTGVMICLFPVMIGLINGRVPPQRPTKREINSSDLLAKLTLCIAISGVLCSVQSVHCKSDALWNVFFSMWSEQNYNEQELERHNLWVSSYPSGGSQIGQPWLTYWPADAADKSSTCIKRVIWFTWKDDFEERGNYL